MSMLKVILIIFAVLVFLAVIFVVGMTMAISSVMKHEIDEEPIDWIEWGKSVC